MTINRADASDMEELAELNRQLIEDERHPNPMTRAELGERMIRWMAEGYRCYVARVGGTTAGYCLFRDDGKHYYLRQLFVARGHRRRGIATSLMDWMYANVWSGKPVRLDVFATTRRPSPSTGRTGSVSPSSAWRSDGSVGAR